jgi:hypothetical protein
MTPPVPSTTSGQSRVDPAEPAERAAFARAELAKRGESGNATDATPDNAAEVKPTPKPLDPEKARSATNELARLIARTLARVLATKAPGIASQLDKRARAIGAIAAERWGERIGVAFPRSLEIAGEVAGLINAGLAVEVTAEPAPAPRPAAPASNASREL